MLEVAKERKVQRRPRAGLRFRRTEDFVRRLRTLLDGGKTSADVAREVAPFIQGGYRIDDSMVRKLSDPNLTASPSSVAIGPICLCYGWPVPPVVDPDPEQAEVTSLFYEASAIDPDAGDKAKKFLRARLAAKRADAELGSDKPSDTPEDSDT